MRALLRFTGHLVWWCGWPVMWLYLNGSKRTRLVLTNERGQILLVRGWISSGNKWSLPGGGMRRRETPLACVVREVCEETGLTISPEHVKKLGEERVRSKGFRFYLYFFTAPVSDDPMLHVQKHEITEACWVDTARLNPHTAEPDVLRALALLASNS